MTRRNIIIAVFALTAVVLATYGCGRVHGWENGERAATATWAPLLGALGAHTVSRTRNREGSPVDAVELFGDTEAAEVIAATVAPSHVGRVSVVLDGETTTATDEGSEVVSARCVLGGIAIGEAIWKKDALSCETVATAYRVTIATGEEKTAAVVQVSTDLDPGVWHDIAADLEFVHTPPERHRVIAPGFVLGVTAGAAVYPVPAPTLGASLSFQWLHPTQQIDLLGVRVTGNNYTARIGVDVVGITPGWRPIRNTGIYLGASYGTDQRVSVDLTLGVRL